MNNSKRSQLIFIFFIVTLSSPFSGCVTMQKRVGENAHDKPAVTRLTREDVIRQARIAFGAHGINVGFDEPLDISCQKLAAGWLWIVHFGGLIPTHYDWMTINDGTGRVGYFEQAATGVRPPATSVRNLFGNEHRQSLVKNADTTRVFLLTAESSNARQLSDYRATAIATLEGEQMQRLISLLLNDRVYRWPDRVLPNGRIRALSLGGAPLYHVCIRLEEKGARIDVVLSFFSQVIVLQDGSIINSAFLGSDSSQILDICRSLFLNADVLRRVDEEKVRPRDG